MNRLKISLISLTIAIFVHIVFLTPLIVLDKKETKKQEKKIKISLKELPQIKKPKIKKKIGKIKKIKKIKKVPPMPKGSQLKKIIKKKIKKQVDIKKPKLKKVDVKEKYIDVEENLSIVKPIQIEEKQDESLSWLYEDRSDDVEAKKVVKATNSSSINQNIKELYGDEFGKLSAGQQKYILDNQEIMRRITQEVLTRVASVNLKGDINDNRVNIVEFYLHPNGDMSDFKFLKKSGYYTLDETTKETIEYAYSRYPLPKEKTLIRYNVYYHLSRY